MKRKFQTIHLFNKVWTVGPVNSMKITGRLHIVIKAPDGVEYHLYDGDATQFTGSWLKTVDARKVKLYILTEILDLRENWCFDLKSKPLPGLVTVLYYNGSLKKIQFVKEFEDKQFGDKIVKPIAWKIK